MTSRLGAFAGDIKLSHTVFALPFALFATFFAAKVRFGGVPPVGVLLLILACMVSARTFAMSANRLLDARLDALNPRTAGRAIPSGRLSAGFVRGMLLLSGAVFVASAWGFYPAYGNPWPAVLALPVLAFLGAYPLLKRFTRLCHYYLGAALALAPVCAWVAVSGGIAWPPVLMAGAVLCWTAGFDIIYACQDVESDRELGVFSVPSALGVGGALVVSRLTHLLCAIFLVLLGLLSPQLGIVYFIGVGCAVALLVVEQSLVSARDLSRVGVAFFTVNGAISLLLGSLGVVDLFV